MRSHLHHARGGFLKAEGYLGVATAACSAICLMLASAFGAAAQDDAGNDAGAQPSPSELKRLPKDGGDRFNRLVFEKSPYLLQHARNQVDWYPWGEEALRVARESDKPIFLSIGYSTCHWCHVMEGESFAGGEVAALLNAGFVCIKVDREERPDIDHVFMNASIASRGSGGWPQSVFMGPDLKPFFLASYIPRESRPDRIGMLELLPQITRFWNGDRSVLLDRANDTFAKLLDWNSDAPGASLQPEIIERAYTQMAARYDPVQGGFGRAPKFPPTHHLIFLLQYWRQSGDAKALQMVEKTLLEMRRGGVFDQLGYGFHRYAVDEAWNTPHFEKMLYDQAMLSMAYTAAYRATGKAVYAQTVREILAYVERVLTSPEGGFYSAEDADSEGEEGKFYVWSEDEAMALLGPNEGPLFLTAYHVEPEGNYLDQASKAKTGFNVLHFNTDIAELSKGAGQPEQRIRERLAAARAILLQARQQRVRPPKDDKVLVDWNGLMIAALAKAGSALDDPRYVDRARRAADFIFSRMRDEQGELVRRYRQGEAGQPAHLEDYAFLAWGLLELYEAAFDTRELIRALELTQRTLDIFWDDAGGGFFMTAETGPLLPVRPKEAFDRARPSGNSIAALNLLRLSRITGKREWEDKARELFKAFGSTIRRSPSAFTQLLSAAALAFGPSYEIVVVGEPGAKDTAIS